MTLSPAFDHPGYAKDLAAGKRSSIDVYGERQASGTITFAGQPSAGHTVTINGKVITFVASGATADQVNISGVDLSTTLDNLVTKLNGHADAGVAKATYVKSGTTILSITFDLYGTVGNDFTIAASNATVSGAKLTGGTDKDKMKAHKGLYNLVTTAGAAQRFLLEDGEDGQELTLYFKAKGTGANAVVQGAFAAAATTATFDAAGDYVKLMFMGGSWKALVNNSVTIA